MNKIQNTFTHIFKTIQNAQMLTTISIVYHLKHIDIIDMKTNYYFVRPALGTLWASAPSFGAAGSIFCMHYFCCCCVIINILPKFSECKIYIYWVRVAMRQRKWRNRENRYIQILSYILLFI